MKCFLHVTEADVVRDIFSGIVNSKSSSTGPTVYVCLLSVCIREFLPINNAGLLTIQK